MSFDVVTCRFNVIWCSYAFQVKRLKLGSVSIVEIQKKTIDTYCLLFHAAQGDWFLLFQISTAIRKSRKNEAIVILLLSRVFFVFELLQLEYFPKIKLKIEVSSFKALFPSFELFKAASNSQFKLWYFNKDSEENTHDFTPPLPNWNYRFIHSTYKSL